MDSDEPQARVWLVQVAFHSRLDALGKFLKLQTAQVLTLQELQSELTEEPTPEELAVLVKQRIEDWQLAVRQGRITVNGRDLVIVLKDYPRGASEIAALYHVGVTVNQVVLVTLKERDKAESYPPSFCEYQDISRGHSPLFVDTELQWGILEVEGDLELQEEPREDPKEENKAKKDPKARKLEELKEEVLGPDDPKLLVIEKIFAQVESASRLFRAYKDFIIGARTKPLVPSEGTVPDSLVYAALSRQVPCNAATPEFLLSCMLLYFQGLKSLDVPSQQRFQEFFQAKSLKFLSTEPFPSSQPSLGLSTLRLLNFNDLIAQHSGRLQFESTGISVKDAQYSLIEALKFPGLSREGMPPESVETTGRVGAGLTELLNCAQLPREEFNRALILAGLAGVLSRKQPERDWRLWQRVYEEVLTLDTFLQSVSAALVNDPDVLWEYSPERDCVYLAVYFRTPPGRVLRKQWSYPSRALPSLQQFKHFKANDSGEYYDIPPGKAGRVFSRTKVMYPSDDSVIQHTKYYIGAPQPTGRTQREAHHSYGVVLKDGVSFGIRATQCFWSRHLNERLYVEMTPQGALLHITTPSLHLKLYPDRTLLQKKLDSEGLEDSRALCNMGHIIKYMKDSSIVLYTPNGEVSTRSKERTWTTVNSRGKVLLKREVDQALFNKPQLAVTESVDPESLSAITIREDSVLKIRSPDASVSCFFPDSSKIHTSPDKRLVVVTAEGLASVKYIFDPVKARQHTVIGMGSSDSGLGTEDVMLRSCDGKLTELLLPTGTQIKTFCQVQKSEDSRPSTVHLVFRQDGTVYKVQQDGEIVLVTGEARSRLAATHGDSAYFCELFSIPEERSSGVYSADCALGTLWTQDSEGNHFMVTAAGEATETLAVSLDADEDVPSPEISDGEFVDEECKFLPPPANVVPPRLFQLTADRITEFLEESQLREYFRTYRGEHFTAQSGANIHHTFIQDTQEKNESVRTEYTIPNSLLPMLQTDKQNSESEPSCFVYREITQFPEFTPEKQSLFNSSLHEHSERRNEQLKYRSSLEAQEPTTEDSRTIQEDLLMRLLKQRGDNELLNRLLPESPGGPEVTESSSAEFTVELVDSAESPLCLEVPLPRTALATR